MARDNRSKGGDREEGGGELGSMPEGCIAHIIACTSPRDACRLSSVSILFKSAADSDAVWERFLPPDYESLITESERLTSASSSSLLSLSSKKEIFLSLCDSPILIDEGKKSFSLDKWSGKKCCMIAARDLSIVWTCTPIYWSWTSVPGARFPEVAKLNAVCWFEMGGKINTRFLSPRTLYTAYLVFKGNPVGFHLPVNVRVEHVGSGSHDTLVERRHVYFHAESEGEQGTGIRHPKKRRDAWLEVELGDFKIAGDEEGELGMSLWEYTDGNWKSGLLVQGIEIRPKMVQ